MWEITLSYHPTSFVARAGQWIVICAALCCGAPAASPRAAEPYTLHSVKAVGEVVGENLRLKVELRAESASEDVVRIPLRFDEAILTEHSLAGGGEPNVKDEGARGGYAWYLGPRAGGKARTWQLSLDMVVPLRVAAGETHLRLAFPQAQQAVSELKLRIPGDVAIGELLGAEQREEPLRKGLGDGRSAPGGADGRGGHTEYTFRRLAGPVSISWYPRGQVVRESGKVRARTFVRTQFDAAAQEFRSDARITVFSAGGTFSEFQVRLPPGATLIEDDPRRFTVEGGSDGRPQIVKVQHEPTARYSLELSLTHPYDGAAKPMELARYEVVGAVRQGGYLTLEVEENYQARFSTPDPQHISPISAADLPREFLEETKLVPGDADAAFELLSSQASLTVACARSEARPRVESDQVVFVEADRLRLEAILRYTTDRPVSRVQFDLPDDWQDVQVASVKAPQIVLPLTPESFAARPGTRRRDVTVQLKDVGSSFALRVTAQRKHAAEPGVMTLGVIQFPTRQAVSERLWVQPADEVSLTPLPAATASPEKPKDKPKTAPKKTEPTIIGLTLLEPSPALPEDVDRHGDRQPALCYRVDAPGATFAARVGSHPQRLMVSSEANISVEDQTIRVAERLKLDLENRPLSQFALHVPEGLEGGLQVDLIAEGRPVRGLTLSDDRALGIVPVDPRRRHVQFANPLRPGKFTLQFAFQQAWSPDVQPGPGRQRVVVPLVTPLSGQWREGRLNLTAKDGFSVRLAGAPDETWRPLAEDSRADAPQRFQSAQPISEAALDILWGAPVVHRLWLDSWLSRDRRIDRLICQFTSDRHPLRIQLPPGAEGLQATLDGKALAQASLADDVVQVPPSGSARTFELRYEVPTETAAWRAQIEPARPTDEAWVRETYWQIVLPETRHLLWSPAGIQRQFSWQWQGWGWGRENHAAPRPIAPAGAEPDAPRAVNAYLFSTLGPPPAVRMMTVDRTWLVVAASGMAFLLGGLMLKVPALRRREVLFAAAVLLAALGLIWPEPFVLVAQAGSLGVVAAVAVLAWKKLASVWRPVFGGGGSTLASAGTLRGSSARGSSARGSAGRDSSAPTRLTSPRSGASVGSSRAVTVSSPQPIQPPVAPETPPPADGSASVGSSRTSGAVATSQGT